MVAFALQPHCLVAHPDVHPRPHLQTAVVAHPDLVEEVGWSGQPPEAMRKITLPNDTVMSLSAAKQRRGPLLAAEAHGVVYVGGPPRTTLEMLVQGHEAAIDSFEGQCPVLLLLLLLLPAPHPLADDGDSEPAYRRRREMRRLWEEKGSGRWAILWLVLRSEGEETRRDSDTKWKSNQFILRRNGAPENKSNVA